MAGDFIGFYTLGGKQVPKHHVAIGILSFYGLVYYGIKLYRSTLPVPKPVLDPEERAWVNDYMKKRKEQLKIPAYVRGEGGH